VNALAVLLFVSVSYCLYLKHFWPEGAPAGSFTLYYCTPNDTVLSQLTSLLSLQKNIVHRDLKLGNLVLNRRTHRVTITNFCLGKHLGSENDLLKDQRGSPAYISPDVLCGKPYLGK